MMVIQFTESEIRDILAAEAAKRMAGGCEFQAAEDAHFVLFDEDGSLVEDVVDISFKIECTFPMRPEE